MIAVLLGWPLSVTPQSPSDASANHEEALRLYRFGRFKEAQPVAARALEVREAALAPNAPEIAESLLLVGRLHDMRAEHDKAEAAFTRARAITDASPDAGPLLAAEAVDRLARHYIIRARYAEAETLARRALAVRESQLAANDVRLAESWATLADVFQSRADA